jgi:Asp-tRNA(Asn)/Glu-tRNA(Gln) amidotransferase A subunit family amidase
VGRAAGLPVGAQLIAPLFAEARMLSVAAAIEAITDAAAEVR